jgi:hypothetical protein
MKKKVYFLFWHWPEGDRQCLAWDGMKVYITTKLPLHQQPSPPPVPKKQKLIIDKITKVLKRGCGVIPSMINYIIFLIDYFEVPKDDIVQLVYNGTSCGSNEVLFVPNFWLPTPASAGWLLGYGYYMVNIDLREMFLNLPLPFLRQRYSGINISMFK